MMELETAKTLLNECVREELRDHAFGDVEVFWSKNGQEIGSGYFNHDGEVSLGASVHFTGKDAWELRDCGVLGTVERNDSTGPDEFAVGKTMPGLTLEGVRNELTR